MREYFNLSIDLKIIHEIKSGVILFLIQWRTSFIALVVLQSLISQRKCSKNAVWLIFGMLWHWQRREKRNKKRDRTKTKGQWTIGDGKITCSSISDLDRKIRFIISHIYSLILFINLHHILDHIYGSFETIKI